MDRIDTDTKAVNLFGAGKHGFKGGDLPNAVLATRLNARWFNDAQEELIAIIEGAGLAPAADVRTQIRQAVKRICGSNVTTVNAGNSPFVLTEDHAGLVLMDAAAGNASATLPAANALLLMPLQFRFLKLDATGNVATVSRAGLDTFVGGATSFTLNGLGDFRTIFSNMVSKWCTLAFAPASSKPGATFLHSGTTAPAGSLVCPTSPTNISRTTYAALFAAIGTVWGAGDGVNTFGMPWAPADYAPVQASGNVGTTTVGEVIAHVHLLPMNPQTNTAAASPNLWAGNASAPLNTGSTGGSANKAAGQRFLICVQY